LGLHTRPVSQTHFIHSHTTSEILPDHQGILCQSMPFLILVYAWSWLITVVLAKALFPCGAQRIQAQNEFPVQEC
jgi:hypothetical protein